MRAALSKLQELYGTQLGNDVIETLSGALVAAGGQAIFTDMTPEEIAMATGGGILAAAVGRPTIGYVGEKLGNRVYRHNPASDQMVKAGLRDMVDRSPQWSRGALEAKLKTYEHLNGPAQLGQFLGRGYGDNIAQGLVALGAPLFIGGEEDV